MTGRQDGFHPPRFATGRLIRHADGRISHWQCHFPIGRSRFSIGQSHFSITQRGIVIAQSDFILCGAVMSSRKAALSLRNAALSSLKTIPAEAKMTLGRVKTPKTAVFAIFKEADAKKATVPVNQRPPSQGRKLELIGCPATT